MAKKPHQRNGGRNHRFFPSLKPMQDALDVIYTTKQVHGGDVHSLDSPSLDGRLAKQAAKMARRAKRAGHEPAQ